MELEEIERLIQLMQRYGLHEIRLQKGEDAVRVSQGPSHTSMMPSFGAPAFVQGGYPMSGGAQRPMYPMSEERGPSDAGSAKAESKGIEIRSPFVGTFYGAPSPGAPNFAQVGKRVSKGDTLCIVEAMKLMNEIEAEHDGVITKVLVENEQPVEYNQLLFVIEP